MYEEIAEILKSKGVIFDKGLSHDEIFKIEECYKIEFPKSLKEFLMENLPISRGFYNWRDNTRDNIHFIKETIYRPIKEMNEYAEEVYWCDEWGEEPEHKSNIGENVRERLKNAPKLIPVYAHRYMPMVAKDNPPVVSISGSDIIYYGKDLKDYFNIEFGGKKQGDIDFCKIEPIPFWSDII